MWQKYFLISFDGQHLHIYIQTLPGYRITMIYIKQERNVAGKKKNMYTQLYNLAPNICQQYKLSS